MDEEVKTVFNPEEDYKLLCDSTILIHNKEVRGFVQDFMKERVPAYFRVIPAARHKEHHMESSHGEGGLVRHTLAVVCVLLDIIQLEYLQFKSLDKDLILSAGILHDTFKHGKEGLNYERTHPSIAAQEILKYAKERNQEKIGKIIGGLVLGHMGQWSSHKPGNRGQFIVHLGDYIGSRKYLTVSLDPLKEAIKQAQEAQGNIKE